MYTHKYNIHSVCAQNDGMEYTYKLVTVVTRVYLLCLLYTIVFWILTIVCIVTIGNWQSCRPWYTRAVWCLVLCDVKHHT